MRSVNRVLTMGLLLIVTACGSSTGPDGPPVGHYPDMPGLVVFYNFDGDLRNAVSNRHHGAALGEITYVADHRGSANSAVYTIGDTIRVADHSELDITGAISVAAWVRPLLTSSGLAAVVDKGYLEAYAFGTGGANEPDTVPMHAVIAYRGLSTDPIVPIGTGEWSHIAFTFDGASGEAKFYLNGAFAGVDTSSVTLGANDGDLLIGRSRYHDRYTGAIDQLAVFRRVLTPEEVADLFAFE